MSATSSARTWVLFAAAIALVSATVSPLEATAFSDTRDPMCRAIVREMHIEIHKHKLRKNGEDDIYDTVPAICLAIVQNYTLLPASPPRRTWSLVKRAVRLDDDDAVEADPSTMLHLMTLKKACETFAEEFQQELSELMYRAALESDIEPVVDSFCSSSAVAHVPPPPPPPRRHRGSRTTDGPSSQAPPPPKKKRTETEAPGGRGSASRSGAPDARAVGGGDTGTDALGGMPDMHALLQKYDTDGSISTLLEMERETPEAMLEADELAEVQRGSVQLRCDVCGAAARVAAARAKKRKALHDEEALDRIVGEVCFGTPPEAAAAGEYPKYPGNPPLWGRAYSVRRRAGADGATAGGATADGAGADGAGADGADGAAGSYYLAKLPKAARDEERGGKEYSELVVKHAMISRACKATVLEFDATLSEAHRPSGEREGEHDGEHDGERDELDGHADLAQTLFEHGHESVAQIAERYCRPFCRHLKRDRAADAREPHARANSREDGALAGKDEL